MAKVGRPAKYETPEEMQTKIEEYFEDCEELRESTYIDKRGNAQTVKLPAVPTIMGLALYLGFAATQSLLDYGEKDEKAFSGIITRAKTRCAEDLNQRALAGQVDARIASLNLGANHGMSFKSDFELTGKDGAALFISAAERKQLKEIAEAVAEQVLLIGDGSGGKPATEDHGGK